MTECRQARISSCTSHTPDAGADTRTSSTTTNPLTPPGPLLLAHALPTASTHWGLLWRAPPPPPASTWPSPLPLLPWPWPLPHLTTPPPTCVLAAQHPPGGLAPLQPHAPLPIQMSWCSSSRILSRPHSWMGNITPSNGASCTISRPGGTSGGTSNECMDPHKKKGPPGMH